MIKVGITPGDINGIGYEIILKAFSDARLAELCIPIIYGSQKMATFHRKALELQQAITFNQIQDTRGAIVNRVNIINCADDNTRIELGKESKEANESALKSLDRVTNDLKRGFIDVLVTAPINQNSLVDGEATFATTRCYLEHKFAKENENSITILVADQLHIALLTPPMPLADVPQAINKEKIVDLCKIFNQSLKRDFSISRPRIAILSLNPSENGKEEQETILPAIQELKDNKILCFGPFTSEKIFGSDEYKRFDGVLAMYHDQGAIPFKALAKEEGVEFTAGLNIVHTSPAQSVSYEMAGKNLSDEEYLRQAIYTAMDVYRNRLTYDEAYANPLQKLYIARGSDNEELDLSGDDNND